MRRFIVSCFIVVMLLVSVLSVNVSAAADFAIASAHFDAVINSDGTVSVTELWTVEYSGTGDGFTRWIDLYDSKNSNEMSTLEKFDSITDISVKIDGVAIENAQSGANTFRYGESTDGKSLNIEINSPSALVTKEYTISYTISGAVKQNGSNAEFAYVFIGKSFQSVSNNVSATVYFPEGVSDISFEDESTGLLSGETVEYSPGRVYDTFSVDVKCSDDIFDSGVLVKYSAFGESLKSFGDKLLDILIWIVIAVIIIVVILLSLFGEKLRRSSIEKRAKKDASADEINELEGNMTACQTYKMLNPYSRISPKSTSKKVPYLFAMAVLECVQNGYIVENENGFAVGTPSGDAPAYILSVLNFLKTFSTQKDNRYIIDSQFGQRVEAECVKSYDTIANYLATFYNLIDTVDGKFFKNKENISFYEKAYLLKTKIVSEKTKTTFTECMTKVLAGSKTGEKEIFALLINSGSANKAFAHTDNDAVASIAYAIEKMYNAFIKSK